MNTATAHCSCGHYQQNGVPCSHAMAFIFSQGEMLEHYLPKSMAIMTWALQYEVALPPIDISGLRPAYNDPDDNADAVGHLQPPMNSRTAWTATQKCQDKASYRASRGLGLGICWRTRSTRATFCSLFYVGHYASTCSISHN